MGREGFKRKLAGILNADVEGYSRLMGEDEEATVLTLTAYREVMTTLIQQHSGTVLDSPGDNLLAEFASVVDAVQCAVAVQREIKTRNNELPDNRRMRFRIGVNLGDVIQEEYRIYGDGVNIAARLEGLAEPGGICISGTAFDHVKGKLSLGYQFVGKQTFKNIQDPIRTYKVLMEPEYAGKIIGEDKSKKWPASMKTVRWFASGFSFKNLQVTESFAEGLIKAGMPGEPSGFYKISAENRLNGGEIKEKFIGRKVVGFNMITGKEWRVERSQSGKATVLDGENFDTGKSWIEDDMLCDQWDNLYESLKDCWVIYRNREGTRENSDKFLGATGYGLYPFSLVE